MINCHQIMATSQASPPATAARHHQPCPCYCWQRRCRRLEQCGQQVAALQNAIGRLQCRFSSPCRAEKKHRTAQAPLPSCSSRKGKFLAKQGMRLIRRPWKGCQFWDVPFTRLQISKMRLAEMGGIGFDFFEFLTCCTCCRMIIRGVGVGGGGGVLTFLTSTSFTLRKMHTLRMLSYDHQGGVGVGGGGVY